MMSLHNPCESLQVWIAWTSCSLYYHFLLLGGGGKCDISSAWVHELQFTLEGFFFFFFSQECWNFKMLMRHHLVFTNALNANPGPQAASIYAKTNKQKKQLTILIFTSVKQIHLHDSRAERWRRGRTWDWNRLREIHSNLHVTEQERGLNTQLNHRARVLAQLELGENSCDWRRKGGWEGEGGVSPNDELQTSLCFSASHEKANSFSWMKSKWI